MGVDSRWPGRWPELGIPIRKAAATAINREQEIASVVRDVERLEPLCIVGGNIKRHGCCENTMLVPQRIKN